MTLSWWSAGPPWWHEFKTASGATPVQYVPRFVQSHCDERSSYKQNWPPECGSLWVSRQHWLSLSLSIHGQLTCLSLSPSGKSISSWWQSHTASVGRGRVCNWIPRLSTCSSSGASHQSRSRWGQEKRGERGTGERMCESRRQRNRDKRHESGLIIVPELQHHSSLLLFQQKKQTKYHQYSNYQRWNNVRQFRGPISLFMFVLIIPSRLGFRYSFS